jgi:hypothetical protein
MRPGPSWTALKAPPDKAIVVFSRPSRLSFLMSFKILDETGSWLGDAVAESSFAVALPPGEHLFVGWAANTEAIHATLAPGRIYYVRVDARVPAFAVDGPWVELRAIKPDGGAWYDLQSWMASSRWLEPRESGRVDNAALEDTGRIEDHDGPDRVRRAQGSWEEYSPEEREHHTLRPDDGLTRDDPRQGPAPSVSSR